MIPWDCCMVLPQYLFVRGCAPKPLCVSLNNAWRYRWKRSSLNSIWRCWFLEMKRFFFRKWIHIRGTHESSCWERFPPVLLDEWEPKSSILHQKRHQTSFWRQPLEFKPLQNIKTHCMCGLCVQRHEKTWFTPSHCRVRCCINVWYWEARFKYTFTVIWVFFLFLIVKEWQSSVMCLTLYTSAFRYQVLYSTASNSYVSRCFRWFLRAWNGCNGGFDGFSSV